MRKRPTAEEKEAKEAVRCLGKDITMIFFKIKEPILEVKRVLGTRAHNEFSCFQTKACYHIRVLRNMSYRTNNT